MEKLRFSTGSALVSSIPTPLCIRYSNASYVHFFLFTCYRMSWASQVVLVVKNLSANAGDIRDVGLIPGSGRSSGEGNHNPLQYSYLENPMDRGAWWATVYRIAKSWTRLKQLNTHTLLSPKHPLRNTQDNFWPKVTPQPSQVDI